jgi:hypothetical protein
MTLWPNKQQNDGKQNQLGILKTAPIAVIHVASGLNLRVKAALPTEVTRRRPTNISEFVLTNTIRNRLHAFLAAILSFTFNLEGSISSLGIHILNLDTIIPDGSVNIIKIKVRVWEET